MKITSAMIARAKITCCQIVKRSGNGLRSKYVPAVFFHGGGNDDEPLFMCNRRGKTPLWPSPEIAIQNANALFEYNVERWKANLA